MFPADMYLQAYTRGLAAASDSDSDSVEHEVESVTDALATGSVTATSTGAVGSEH